MPPASFAQRGSVGSLRKAIEIAPSVRLLLEAAAIFIVFEALATALTTIRGFQPSLLTAMKRWIAGFGVATMTSTSARELRSFVICEADVGVGDLVALRRDDLAAAAGEAEPLLEPASESLP